MLEKLHCSATSVTLTPGSPDIRNPWRGRAAVRGNVGGRDTGLSFVDIRLAIQGTNPAARPDRELNVDAIVLAMIPARSHVVAA